MCYIYYYVNLEKLSILERNMEICGANFFGLIVHKMYVEKRREKSLKINFI